MYIHSQVHRKVYLQSVAKNPDSTIYNIPFLFKLDSEVDVEKLSNAITATVKAHSYLLTRVFLNDNGEMVQSPCDEEFIPKIINLTDKEFDSVKNNLVRPFKLEKKPLVPL